eukprot:6213051-Pleurochrysis_carterae.AAC.2
MHVSVVDCLKPCASSQGKSVRCHLRPACAIPYTGFCMRQIRGRPSDPMVAYPGGGWQYTTSPGSSSPWRYAATKSQRLMRIPIDAASDASARREVPRMAAQKEPGRRVGGHGLFARLGGLGGWRGGECAASRSAVDVAVSARRPGKKRGVGRRTQVVGSQLPLEVLWRPRGVEVELSRGAVVRVLSVDGVLSMRVYCRHGDIARPGGFVRDVFARDVGDKLLFLGVGGVDSRRRVRGGRNVVLRWREARAYCSRELEVEPGGVCGAVAGRPIVASLLAPDMRRVCRMRAAKGRQVR